ncbi:hypothetical protein IHE56_15055 [Streptomyces sp. ID01-12c]|uniref:hypothetical protein n=1 Tax=Streptomyces caniscabiei TaxID=2746961 RepID=UPI001784A896|nr:hypothetical protein [Streptomyces caniscabiei]MBD9703375.1 hypothetical protein [Streptomyces caniscabiei]MDX3726865.1 hypothetical protein [Streptomyces caniscabiei]
MFFFDSVVRVRAGTRTDRGGNTVKDWSPGAVSRLTIGQLNIQPTSQTEQTDATRTAVVTGWRVQSEEGTAPDITAADRIEWNGMLLEVQGEVAPWPDPLTDAHHHTEFTMVRATG